MADNIEVGRRIQMRRKQLGLTLDDISAAIDVAKSTVQRYEKGTIQKLKMPVLESIANALRVNPSWLACKSDEMLRGAPRVGAPYRPFHSIPILGRITAGLPTFAEENIEGYTFTDRNGDDEYFALRVQGDSMNLMRIYDGSILIVRRQDIVEDGQIAVVLVDGEDATVKRFSQRGFLVTLTPHSTNPEHMPQVYDIRKTKVRVLGRVVECKTSFD
jgi:repressor LexA